MGLPRRPGRGRGPGGRGLGPRGVDSWIDVTVLNSAFATFLIAPAAFWAWVVLRRLWVAGVERDAALALARARDRGLVLAPSALGLSIIARGNGLSVVWTTGILGDRSVVRGPRGRRVAPLVTGADELDQLLAEVASA